MAHCDMKHVRRVRAGYTLKEFSLKYGMHRRSYPAWNIFHMPRRTRNSTKGRG